MSTSETKNLFDAFDPPDMGEWRSIIDAQLKGMPFEKLITQTPEGIAVQPMYNRADIADKALPRTIPGATPYVRGNRAQGYKSKAWTVAQELPYASPAAFNEAALADLARGQDALILRVGERGVKLETAADLEQALKGIDLTRVPVYLQAGADTARVLGLFEELGIKIQQGGLGLDPLGHLAVYGVWPEDLEQTFAAAAGLCSSSSDAVRVLDVDVTGYGNSGASAVVELAVALSTTAAYMNALIQQGVEPSAAAANIRLVLSIGGDFFMEMAKFRAARALWANLVQAYGADQPPVVFGSASTYNKTVYDPYVNLLRTTTEGFSGVLGGCDGITLSAFDDLVGEPSPFSRRIARNTQLVLRDEVHLTKVVDPAGGSWYVEAMTSELCNKSWDLFQTLEADGGVLAALQSGRIQDLVDECHATQAKKLSQRRHVLVGTNMYANVGETLPEATPFPACEAPAASPVVSVRPLTCRRLADGYEALRDETAETPIKAFMANMGPVSQHKVRCDFCTEFLRPAGITVDADQQFDDAEAAAAAAVASGAALTVICSTDDTYPDLVPAFARAVKAAKPGMTVLMAGLIPDRVDEFKQAGVDDFIHIKANNLDLLKSLVEGASA